MVAADRVPGGDPPRYRRARAWGHDSYHHNVSSPLPRPCRWRCPRAEARRGLEVLRPSDGPHRARPVGLSRTRLRAARSQRCRQVDRLQHLPGTAQARRRPRGAVRARRATPAPPSRRGPPSRPSPRRAPTAWRPSRSSTARCRRRSTTAPDRPERSGLWPHHCFHADPEATSSTPAALNAARAVSPCSGDTGSVRSVSTRTA